MAEIPQYQTYRATLVSRRPEYDGVDTYRFTTEEKIPFTAGSYVHLRVPGVPEGEKAVRELSFASPPEEEEVWFGIDSRSDSPYQRALKKLEKGDAVELFKIKSHLSWPPGADEVVMVAGAVGITPFRSQILDREARALPVSVSLVHAARRRHLYGDELAPLVNDYVETDRDGLEEAVRAIAAAHPRAAYEVAGSEGFVARVVGLLRTLQVSRIEADNFSGLEETV